MFRSFMLLSLSALFTTLSYSKVISKGVSEGMPYEVEQVVDGLSIPWGLAFISPNEMLITERRGALRKLNINSRSLTNINGLPNVLAEGQGGLLDVAVAPDFTNKRWLYFTYSKQTINGGATTLARARFDGKKTLHSWQDLLVTKVNSDTSRHYGSRIAFDLNGHVYFTVGDRGNRNDAQILKNHAGTVIRLKTDGSVPEDNPFFGSTSKLNEIWSYGHRNPQGLVYDSKKNRLWLIEHGPRGGDEINLVHKGKNYGWPVISYGKEYWAPISVGEGTHRKGMEQPVKYYVPSIAPSSLALYQGDAFPEWRGNLFAGALVMTHLNRVIIDDQGQAIGEERLLKNMGERVRAVVTDKTGRLYLSTDSGKILKIRPGGL